MKLRLLLVLLSMPTIVVAQKNAPHSREQVQKQVLAIEDRIGAANHACDYTYFRQVEADEFLFTDSQGNVSTKQEDLAGEKQCKPREFRRTVDEPRLILLDNTAVLSARSTITGEREGKAFRIQTRFTDVFVWRGGRWQIVAGHSSRIPQKP